MSAKPKITIITPVLNQITYIEQCIQSVLNQNYSNLEYIIVDGGSIDGTLEIIQKYCTKITYYISEPDFGQSDAINKGLKLATGEIFNWLNADDYYENGALDTIADFFMSNPNFDIFSGKANIIKSNSVVRQSGGVMLYTDIAQTIGNAVINQPETFFKTKIIKQIGFLNTELQYNMDKDFWIKYLLMFGSQKVHKNNAVLVNFRLHDASKTVAQHDNFTPERDALFLSIAKWCKQLRTYNLLANELNIKELQHEFELNTSISTMEGKKIFSYYLLLKSDEYFVANNRSKLKSTIFHINPFLIKSNIPLYAKLMVKYFLKIRNTSRF